MKVLVTGVTGQVGAALMRTMEGRIIGADRELLDLANPASIAAAIRATRPEVIVNPAAFTSVDRAEGEPQLAHAINAEAPGIIAEEAKRLDALLVHYSTDYVFDGRLRRPYIETDATHPLSVYGKTKLEGEARVRASGCRHAILRTSWVYGGPTNFPMRILEIAKKKEALRVVSDQTGVPTWAADVAMLTKEVIRRQVTGTWHASAAGAVTRYEYAMEVLRLAGMETSVEPIAISEFPSPAQRPAYSALDSSALQRETGIRAIGPWRERLVAYMGGAA
jgi:dTDP-4-dehydrorhamnose reductase